VTPDEARPHRPLASHLTPGEAPDHSEILDRFLAWVADTGLELYPEQEEAILELLDDRHVVLSTPTGSGKSLVAMARPSRRWSARSSSPSARSSARRTSAC
jgi:superfamily II RNA helicase